MMLFPLYAHREDGSPVRTSGTLVLSRAVEDEYCRASSSQLRGTRYSKFLLGETKRILPGREELVSCREYRPYVTNDES